MEHVNTYTAAAPVTASQTIDGHDVTITVDGDGFTPDTAAEQHVAEHLLSMGLVTVTTPAGKTKTKKG